SEQDTAKNEEAGCSLSVSDFSIGDWPSLPGNHSQSLINCEVEVGTICAESSEAISTVGEGIQSVLEGVGEHLSGLGGHLGDVITGP
ncbi:MAG: hypothetical protein WCD18_10905, partial [Thermosynechococcaceae cyanobacterium]